MKKEVMISIRITPKQYVTLLETLIKTNQNKSEFIRESLLESIDKMTSKNCRKRDITNWLGQG